MSNLSAICGNCLTKLGIDKLLADDLLRQHKRENNQKRLGAGLKLLGDNHGS
jgi:hypothetical protein